MKSKKDKAEEIDSCKEADKQKPDNKEVDTGKEAAEKLKPEDAVKEELEALKAQLDEKTKQNGEFFSALQRAAAEFDNFKKRTTREKEALYTEAVGDVTAAFLPVLDNLERAIDACNKENETGTLKDGVDMVCRQIKDVLKNIGIEEIKSVNETFDPNLHNAVMHVEDDSVGPNIVIDEFQKGYMYKEKVIRHSIVKVAN